MTCLLVLVFLEHNEEKFSIYTFELPALIRSLCQDVCCVTQVLTRTLRKVTSLRATHVSNAFLATFSLVGGSSKDRRALRTHIYI